ncbi:MAG: YdiU family protein [Verrucomicrobiaceae bacterium]|nr:MAG: YdiU family protein [Verrucomicrobiaceae bacterium]
MSNTPLPAAALQGWRLENTYQSLPPLFFSPARPQPVRNPRLILFNRDLAAGLGLAADELAKEEHASLFTGNTLPEGAEPIAQAYAGHQFGNFTGLGDGRAILLGEQVTPAGRRYDIQLKGAGRTPYSRSGDGRAAVGPMLREYIISEAMHALGIPTTRSLAVAGTGEPVHRGTALPGAVLTRVASSHIRVGTFEWAAAKGGEPAVKALLAYSIQRHYPGCAGAGNPAAAFFDAVVERQASLIAQWLLVGFIHGVMNTDNMAISGETIDYGPCAFMNEYDPATVFSSIDHQGRYAYGNQSAIAQWNLARLAETLLPLFHDEEKEAIEWANGAIGRFQHRFENDWLAGMRAKLGLVTQEEGDRGLADSLLSWMEQARADWTLTFRLLSTARTAPDAVSDDPAFREWRTRWLDRLRRQPPESPVPQLMERSNPAVIPRNHRVEEALAAAADADEGPLNRLLEAVTRPWEETSANEPFRGPPPPASACGYRTFCGT